MTRQTPQQAIYVHPLSYIRAERGWTYQDLVNIIAKRVGNMATRREKAWRWEHRGIVPDHDSQLALAAELGVPPEQVELVAWPRWLPAGEYLRTAVPWTQTGSVEAIEDALERAMLDRRGFMILTASSLAGLAEEWLHLEPGHLAAILGGGRVTEEFLLAVEDGLPRLRMLEAAHGGDRTRRLIDAELGMVAQVLSNSSYSAAMARRLHVLAAELSRMAGWASFDAGLHAAAQRYWVAGIHAAYAADDRPLGANIIKSMSLQCYDFARPEEALRLASSAYAGVGGGATPRTRAMLALREARAHAALGDRVACERRLAEADTALAHTSATAVDPAWVSYFDEAEFAAQVGTCYLDLKQPAIAERYLDQALTALPGSKVRDQATYAIRRGWAQLGLGDLDHACALATDAIPLIQQAPSERNVQRVMRLRARMPLPASDPRAQRLDQRLADLVA